MNKNTSSYLMHYGVKGMKWGVRHDRITTGNNYQKRRNNNVIYKHRKAIRRTLIATAAVSAAALIGIERYKYGLMKTDRILKAGTVVQNIAPSGRKFDIPFYGVDDVNDMAYYAKHFTTKDTPEKLGRNVATYLTNKSKVRIAGKKAMDKAYKKAYGWNPIKREIFYRRLGALKPEQKARFNRELIKRGYGGHKDINDMQFLFGGNTPIVYFGSHSGFSPFSEKKIDIKKAKKVHVLTGVGKRTIAETGAMTVGVGSVYGVYKANNKKEKQK